MPETSSQPAAPPEAPSDGRPDGQSSPRADGRPDGGGYQPGDFEEAFRQAKHAVANASISVFARHGVYEGQQFVLRRLWREDGLTPGQIARQLGLATPTVTRAANRMEATGLLRREPDPKDGRLVRLWLTGRGRELEQVIGPEMNALTEQTLAGFTDQDRAELIRALRRMHENLSGLDAVERLGVGELAAHVRVVGGERADLEVRAPAGVLRGDVVVAGRAEAEPRVVVGRAEQGDQGLAEGVGGAEYGVHEGAAGAAPLPVRADGQRAEGEHGGGVGDVQVAVRAEHGAPGADDVAGDVALGIEGDERELRYPGRAVAQPVDQGRLHRFTLAPPGEGRRGQRVDGGSFTRGLATDQHLHTMPAREWPGNYIRPVNGESTVGSAS
jgi:MarR family transcriptional regulator, organic hydroperoxide resistance regulator